MATSTDLADLKKNYARGILKAREGDTWIEFQNMKDMRIAINDLESELAGGKPSGTRKVTVSNGY